MATVDCNSFTVAYVETFAIINAESGYLCLCWHAGCGDAGCMPACRP